MSIASITKESLKRWWAAEPGTLGAALSFYALFYLAPVLLLVIYIVGALYGRQAAEYKIIFDISRITGPQAAAFIQSLITGFAESRLQVATAFVSGGTIVIGAYFLFHQISVSLNKVFRPETAEPVLKNIGRRLISLSLVFILGLAMTISIVLDAAISVSRSILADYVPQIAGAADVAAYAVPFCLTVLFTACVYKFASHQFLTWSASFVGSLVTGILFVAGRLLIGLYIGWNSGISAYGAASAVIIILLWTYYLSQIFFFGAAWAASFDEARRNPAGVPSLPS